MSARESLSRVRVSTCPMRVIGGLFHPPIVCCATVHSPPLFATAPARDGTTGAHPLLRTSNTRRELRIDDRDPTAEGADALGRATDKELQATLVDRTALARGLARAGA